MSGWEGEGGFIEKGASETGLAEWEGEAQRGGDETEPPR